MIVFPMAGLSSRFTEAGYSTPKYMLDINGKSVFRHVVEGFSGYFESTDFLFIMREVADTPRFVAEECRAMGITTPMLVTLPGPTQGQADTVLQGVERVGISADTPMTIFNIDTFRPGFVFPQWIDISGGYLEVFPGEGANWSYVEPDQSHYGKAVRTTEKDPVSDLCCTGLYHFGKAADFIRIARQSIITGENMVNGELYIAPLYNLLIQEGMDIRYHCVAPDEVVFCGTPAEYEEILRNQ